MTPHYGFPSYFPFMLLMTFLVLATSQLSFAQETVSDAWQNNIPTTAAALKEEAKMLIEQRDYQGAIAKLEESLVIKQDYYLAVYNLAIAYALRGTNLQAPSQHDRNRAWHEINRARTIAEGQRIGDAALYSTIGWLASMEAIFTQPEEFSQRTVWYDRAQQYWEYALTIDSASVDTLNNLGALYELRGDSKRAGEYYAKAKASSLVFAQETKTDRAIRVVKELCLTGTQFDLKADAKGNLTLRKLFPGGERVVYVNVHESLGAVAIFDVKIRQIADEDIRRCIQPHIKQIIDAILAENPKPNLQVSQVTVPSTTNEGVELSVRYSGDCTVQYENGGYKLNAQDFNRWSTAIIIFKNLKDPEEKWIGNSLNTNSKHKVAIIGGKITRSQEEAEKAARGIKTEVGRLNETDTLTFMAMDSKTSYGDNEGEVELELSCVPR